WPRDSGMSIKHRPMLTISLSLISSCFSTFTITLINTVLNFQMRSSPPADPALNSKVGERVCSAFISSTNLSRFCS
ncbi:hypothetical protein SISNIDRAFT_453549, partial [Sistotremastrum niveocremeum HHB9708]